VTLAASLAALCLLPGAAAAQFYSSPVGFQLQASSFTVAQNAGSLAVTITRQNAVKQAQIRYTTLPGTAIRGQDYQPVKSMFDFMPGQASATFHVPIIDHGAPEPAKTFRLTLFGPHSEGIASPYQATVTILSGTVASLVRNPLNPLGLTAAPPSSDPLLGARPFVDWRDGLAAVQQRLWRRSHPRAAAELGVIASQPEVHRWGNWTGPNVGLQASQFLERAAIEEPGTVPEFATYYVVESKRSHPQCHHYADPPWRQAAYHRWIESLASGIGNYRAIMFMEMDSLITVGCLSHHGLQVRLHELHDAIDVLSKVPRLVVYLDAGAADALPAKEAASLLNRSGVREIQGFFLNSTHFDWTSKEIKYGEQISRMTGGRHFVINTAENGQGPLVPHNRVKNGNEVLCMPPGRGLGPKPTFDTGYPNVDAFAWIANPGKSGGPCRHGAPPTGYFWPKLALELIHHADFTVR
jgi:endoglucanase